MQDDIFKPNHYLSLMEFRQLTLERLQKFVAQQFFVTKDYLDGAIEHLTSPYAHVCSAAYTICVSTLASVI